MRARFMLGLLAVVLAMPVGFAKNVSDNGENESDGLGVYTPSDEEAEATPGLEESVGLGWSTTAIVLAIVVALVVIVLIAAAASRGRVR